MIFRGARTGRSGLRVRLAGMMWLDRSRSEICDLGFEIEIGDLEYVHGMA